MKVILSIKPKFAEKIFNGSKKFEFRRSMFKSPEVKNVVVYASAPISKIIGEFEIDEILHKGVDQLWKATEKYSGISEDYYYDYFEGKEKGYAIKIKEVRLYPRHFCIHSEYGLKPPQSFAYIK